MRATPHWQADIDYHWTPRQREVLDLIARGRTNGEIADALGVTLAGAKWHVSEVLSKLNAASREEAADYWRETNRLPRRFSRAVRALGGFPFVAKGLAGTASIGAVGALVVAGIAAFGGSGSNLGAVGAANQDTAAQPTPTPFPSWMPPDSPLVRCSGAPDLPVARLQTLQGEATMYARRIGDTEYCFGLKGPAGEHLFLAGPLSTTGLERMSFDDLDNRTLRLLTAAGTVSSGAQFIEVLFEDGSRERYETFPAPAGLGIDLRFFYFEPLTGAPIDRILTLDADGGELGSVRVWGQVHRGAGAGQPEEPAITPAP